MSAIEPNSERDTFRTDLRLGVRIARAEAVDLWRRNDSRRQRALYALLAVLLLPTAVLFIRLGYTAGVEARTGIEYPVVAVARNLLLPGMLVFAVLGGLGAAQSLARDSVRTLLLTTVSTRAIVVGKLLYLLGTWLVPMLFVTVPLLAFAVGARSPLLPVSVAVFGLPVLLLTMLVGLTLAYLLWLGIERLGLPEGARKLVTAGLSLVIFVAAFTGGFLSGRVTGEGLNQLPSGDPATPLGWYADLLFLGSPLAESLRAETVVAVLLVVLGLGGAFAVQVRVAPAFWYTSPAHDDSDEEDTTGTDVPAFERPPSELVGRGSGWSGRAETLRIALGYVRSAVRRPDQYVYLFYYVFPVLAILLPLGLEQPSLLLPVGGGVLILLGFWLAGAVFCLNPLGSEGAMLSQLVLAETPPERFVHARLVSGVGLGLALALPGVVVYGATGPFTTPTVILLGCVLVVNVVVASAGFALGIGSALPKFEEIAVFDSVETLAPSVVAALVHGAVTLLLALGALVTTAGVAFPDSTLSPTRKGGALLLFAVTILVTVDGSRRYAIARLGQYGREQVRVGRLFAVYAGFVLSTLAVLIAQAMGLAFAVLLGQATPEILLVPTLFVIQYAGYTLAAVGFLYVTHRGIAYLDVNWPSARETGGILGGVVASLAIWGSASVLISGLGLPVADHALFSSDDANPRMLLALVPLLLFVNGPIEELLYRNVIQKYLQEWFSTTVAVGLASAIFALAHVPAYFTAGLSAMLVTLGLLFCLSCVWGAIYARTNSLTIVAAIHGLYNALLLCGAYLATL
jgi:membrane protease YdiL (CAAX protease family)